MYCILNAKIVILSGDKIELPMNIHAGNIEVVENLFHSSVKKKMKIKLLLDHQYYSQPKKDTPTAKKVLSK